MIIVKLIGGLGNQMFQYAVGQQIAIKRKTELKLDITAFKRYKLHAFSLNHLCVSAKPANLLELARFGQGPLGRLTKTLIDHKKIINEQGLDFHSKILDSPDNSYLDGYWQSEKYFFEIAGLIRKEFKVKNELSGQDKEVAKKIQAVESVSLHIRRADYVTNKNTLQVHGICGLEYYHQAVEMLGKKSPDLQLFIFSDDQEWAKNNLSFPHPIHFVDHNQADKNYEDLRLMSLCRHNIIANSSFSWWGAWLNSNPEKIVIAPKKWFNDPTRSFKDIVPESWIKL